MNDEFWETVCAWRPVYRALFAFNMILLALLGISLPSLTPGSSSFHIAIASVAIILVTVVGTGYVLRKCANAT